MSLGSITGGDQSMRRVVERLEARIAELERSARAIPARLPAGGGGVPVTVEPTVAVFLVGGGNALATVNTVGITGIKPGYDITAIPVRTPVSGSTYTNGLGYGRAVVAGAPVSPYVWIANRVLPPGFPDNTTKYDSDSWVISGNNIGCVRYRTLPVTGSATNASVTATASGGVITGLTLVSGGSGYTSAPLVAFSTTSGDPAVATATVSGGAVTSVTLVSGGSGYGASPTVTVYGDSAPVWMPYYV